MESTMAVLWWVIVLGTENQYGKPVLLWTYTNNAAATYVRSSESDAKLKFTALILDKIKICELNPGWGASNEHIYIRSWGARIKAISGVSHVMKDEIAKGALALTLLSLSVWKQYRPLFPIQTRVKREKWESDQMLFFSFGLIKWSLLRWYTANLPALLVN